MTESSPASPDDDSWKNENGWENFDAKEFARTTIWSIEAGDESRNVDELRLTRIEECIAARWPRRWLLWARLRREIRASVATWDDDYIPRRDFTGRRLEWSGQQGASLYQSRQRRHAERLAEEDAERLAEPGQDERGQDERGADPAAGFLP